MPNRMPPVPPAGRSKIHPQPNRVGLLIHPTAPADTSNEDAPVRHSGSQAAEVSAIVTTRTIRN